MATLTPLVPNGDRSTSTNVVLWNRGTTAWTDTGTTGAFSHIDEAVGAIASGDTGIGLLATANVTQAVQFELSATDADFQSMDSISAHFDLALQGTYSDDTGYVRATIFNSSGTALTNQITLINWNGSTFSPGTPPRINQTIAFTLTAAGIAATKTDWDNAYLQLTFADVKTKASDGATFILADIRLTGTYTAGSVVYDETGRQVSITSTVSSTDLLSAIEDRAITITATVTSTDVDPNAIDACLVVADAGAPTTGDALLNTWLTNLGFAVTYVSDDAAEASGYDLCVISESCNSTTLGTKYKDTTMPTVNMENGSWDDHNYVNAAASTAAAQTTYDIGDDTHPLAAGLKGSGLTVYSTGVDVKYSLDANLPASAIKVVNVAGQTTQWSLFGFESGATIQAADTTESRRVCMSMFDTGTPSLVPQGRWLFEQACRWASQLDVGVNFTQGHVLYVASSVDLLSGDENIVDRLRGTLGYKTTCFLDSDVTLTDASGFDLVCVSKSGQSADTADTFKTFTGGYWTFEDNLQAISISSVAMMCFVDKTNPVSTAWHATGTDIVIKAGAPTSLTGGLTGTITLLTSSDEITYSPNDCGGTNGSCLASGATEVAEFNAANDGRWSYYAFESGATLADASSAAGRRVFFPLYHNDVGDAITFDKLTADGLTLFDASITWAAATSLDETGRQVVITSAVTSTDVLHAVEDRSVTITSTVTSTDVQTYVETLAIDIGSTVTSTDARKINETGRQVTITSTVTSTDVLHAVETLAETVTSTVTSTDVQHYVDSLAETITATITSTDVQTWLELDRPVVITATVTLTDVLSAIEALAFTITSSISSTDNLQTPGSYDETGRQVSITATISSVDTLNSPQTYDETGRTVVITSTLTSTDVQNYVDALAVSIASALTSTDVQAYVDALAVAITSTITSTDALTFNETGRTVTIISTVSSTDTFNPVSSFDETGRQVVITSTVAGTDAQTYLENVAVDIGSAVTSTDLLAGIEDLSFTIASTVISTDVLSGPQVFDETSRTLSIASTVSCTDLLSGVENVTVDITALTSASDAQHYIEPTLLIEIIATVTVNLLLILPGNEGVSTDRGRFGVTDDRGKTGGSTDRGLIGSTSDRGRRGYTQG